MIFIKKDLIKTFLFAFVVSIVLVFFVLEIKKFKNEEDLKEVEKRVVIFDSNEIKKIKFNEFSLQRDKKNFIWKLTSPITDYLNYSAVENWVSRGLSQEGRNLSDGDESLNWGEFGLDQSLSKITYITENGLKTSVELSKKKAFDGSSYLRVSEKNSEKLYSSTDIWEEVFSKKVKNLRSLQVFNWEVPSPSSLPRVLSFYKKGKKYLSLTKAQDWKALEFSEWTLDTAKVESFISEIKTYLHDGFMSGKEKLKRKEASIVVNTDSQEEYVVNFYDRKYAVSSYRPEHIMKISKEGIDILMVNPLDLRSFRDVDGDAPNGEFDRVDIKIKKKMRSFFFKNNIWVLNENKENDKFNGARVFIFLNKLKKINYKRFVSDKGIVFRSAKKRIYLLKNGKIEIKYSIGPDFPCEKTSKYKKCVLLATNKLKKAYVVALKTEVNEIFNFNFYTGND